MDPVATPAALPADPMTQTRNRMAELAQDQAEGFLWRQIRSQLKGILPKFLHPLIPGERGTVAGNLKAEASKRMWAAVTGLIISLVFFAFFAVAIVGFVLVTGFAVVSSM